MHTKPKIYQGKNYPTTKSYPKKCTQKNKIRLSSQLLLIFPLNYGRPMVAACVTRMDLTARNGITNIVEITAVTLQTVQLL